MKVVILCGGQGTRLREETEYKPKPMVEIGGKPILWHIMKLYAHFGYKEFILALGYKGNVIRDYFLNYHFYNCDFTVNLGNKEGTVSHNDHNEHDWKVTLVETGAESMTGHRVKQCGKYIDTDRFMLTYGDAVSNVNIDKLVAFNTAQGTMGTVTGVYPPSRFGDLETTGELVKKFREKEHLVSDDRIINGGFFVFRREFLDLIPDDPKCDLEKVPLDALVQKNELSVYRHKEFWQCMDTYRDYELLNKMWQVDPVWKVWS